MAGLPDAPRLKSLLERDWAGIEVLPIGTEETALQVKRSGVDAAIIGNAA